MAAHFKINYSSENNTVSHYTTYGITSQTSANKLNSYYATVGGKPIPVDGSYKNLGPDRYPDRFSLGKIKLSMYRLSLGLEYM